MLSTPPRPWPCWRHQNPYPIDATKDLTPSTPPRPWKYPVSPFNANIVGSFPNMTIELIISRLTCNKLNSIHLNIKQNTAFFDSKIGYGLIGILPLTVSAAVYNTLSNIPFLVPTKPGPHTTGNITAIQIAAFTWVHTENRWMWESNRQQKRRWNSSSSAPLVTCIP